MMLIMMTMMILIMMMMMRVMMAIMMVMMTVVMVMAVMMMMVTPWRPKQDDGVLVPISNSMAWNISNTLAY